MPCYQLEWNTGPIPDDMKHVLVLNIFKEYEIGTNEGTLKVDFVPVEGGLYRKVVTHLPDWNGIYDMDLVAAWAELPDPELLVGECTTLKERLDALQGERP